MKDEQIDFIFKAIAHAERRRILASLRERPGQSLFEICASSAVTNGRSLSRQTITQHLDALERAGLLDISWKGRAKVHSIRLEPLQRAVATTIGDYLLEKEQ